MPTPAYGSGVGVAVGIIVGVGLAVGEAVEEGAGVGSVVAVEVGATVGADDSATPTGSPVWPRHAVTRAAKMIGQNNRLFKWRIGFMVYLSGIDIRALFALNCSLIYTRPLEIPSLVSIISIIRGGVGAILFK
jgi:hypothetical protein